MAQEQKTIDQIQSILEEVRYKDWTIRLMEKGSGFLLQWVFEGIDVEHPEEAPVPQYCRKWYVSPFSTTTEIVETAWKACWVAVLHEVREEFTYKHRRVYSPHFDIQSRVELCDKAAYDIRED